MKGRRSHWITKKELCPSLLLAAAVLLELPFAAIPLKADYGAWTLTGSMTTAREFHTLTLLANGNVLAAGGGLGGTVLSSAELYNPATGSWTGTSTMPSARYFHTATLLADGKVLLAGGIGSTPGVATSTTALYNASAGTWTAGAALYAARYDHAATLVTTSRVLVTGGIDIYGHATSFAELYDPSWGWLRVAGTGARQQHTATLLPNGKVLVAGGADDFGVLSTAELYDPAFGSYPIIGSSTSTGSMNYGRRSHTATLLNNGKVLVAGGVLNSGYTTASAELFDPSTGTWTATGSMPIARNHHTAALLADGRVLVVAGIVDAGYSSASVALYDPTAGTWSSSASLNNGRYYHAMAPLADGRVLVAGGNTGSADTTSTEVVRFFPWVDAYIDMEQTGSDGDLVTAWTASGATHPDCGSCWSTVRIDQDNTTYEDMDLLSELFLSTEHSPLPRWVIAGGTPYSGASAQSWRMHNENGTGPYHPEDPTSGWRQQYAKYTVPSGTIKMSIGLAMKWSSAGAGWGLDSEFYDLLAIEGVNKEFLVLNGESWRPPPDTGGLIVRAHTSNSAGTSDTACYVNMDQWYWVTMLWDKNDKGYIRVYDMTTWAELPGSPLSLEWGNNLLATRNANFVAIGRYDNHGNAQLDADYYNDSLLIDYTNAAFPLLP